MCSLMSSDLPAAPYIEYPKDGYMAVDSFLFLKEQIKGIIITGSLESFSTRQHGLPDACGVAQRAEASMRGAFKGS